MTEKIILIACYAVMYAGFHAWTDNTLLGGRLKKFLMEWNTDWVHGIIYSFAVATWGACAILAVGLTLHHFHI